MVEAYTMVYVKTRTFVIMYNIYDDVTFKSVDKINYLPCRI